MIGNIFSEYQFQINYQRKGDKSFISARISHEIIDSILDRLFYSCLGEDLSELKEPWYVILPEIEPNHTILMSAKAFENPFGINSIEYKRPEHLARLVLPRPNRLINILKIEIYEMNMLFFSCWVKIEDLFIVIVDSVANNLFSKELESNEIVYYGLYLTKRDIYQSIQIEGASLNVLGDDRIIEGVFEIPQLRKDRSRISFSKIKDDALPIFDKVRFANSVLKGRGILSSNRVVLSKNNYNELCYQLSLSKTEENGGYLIGNVYRSPDSQEDENHPDHKWLVEVTNIVPAEHAFGNSLVLLFTNETWSRLNKRLDNEFPSKKIVGWYHSHLFPATDDFGLSHVDQILHKQFFSKPWQIALLLNIETNGSRELRSFQKLAVGEKLNESKYEVLS